MKTKRQKQGEREIRDLIERWSRAVEARDAAGIVEAYTPKTVLFDAIPPYRTVGADAIKAVWEGCFPYFPDTFRSEHKDLAVEVDGDVAFVHALHRFVPEPAGHPCGATWMRVTACYRRIDGAWTVAHEHVSVPFDPMTGKASYITGSRPKDAKAEAAPERPASNAQQPVTPHLVCAGAEKAIAFYKKAFGATEEMRLPTPDGKLMHACVMVNGAPVMLVDEFPEMGAKAPTSLKGTPVTIHLNVPDVDGFVERAVKAGATVEMPVADMFWGDRYGIVRDPFGHKWSIATHQRDMTPAEIQDALKRIPSSGEARA